MKAGWQAAYNCHSLEVSDALYIAVNWDGRRYVVFFGEKRLMDTFIDLGKAKAAGLRLSNRVLTEAINNVIDAQKEI